MLIGSTSILSAMDKDLGNLIVAEREKLFHGRAYFFSDVNDNFNVSLEADELGYTFHVSEMFGRKYGDFYDLSEEQLKAIRTIIDSLKDISVVIQKVK